MKIVAEYRRQAADCERAAGEMHSEDQRQRLLWIAASWRALADQREARLAGCVADHRDADGLAAMLRSFESKRARFNNMDEASLSFRLKAL